MIINEQENLLICKNIKFYSQKDETAFLKCIEKIDCVDQTSTEKNKLHLHIAAEKIHDNDLRDLIGLFFRYKVEMTQLARFLTDENKAWFYDNKRKFWHKKVFKKYIL